MMRFKRPSKFVDKQAARIAQLNRHHRPTNNCPSIAEEIKRAKAAAIVDFCHAILCSNEFLYVRLKMAIEHGCHNCHAATGCAAFRIGAIAARFSVSRRRRLWRVGAVVVAEPQTVAAERAASIGDNPLAPKPRRCRRKPNRSFGAFSTAAQATSIYSIPRPTLNKLAGKPLPGSFPRPKRRWAKPPYAPNGQPAQIQAVRPVGYLGERLAVRKSPQCVDDIAVIRCCWADGLTHVGSVCEMNTGSILMGRPASVPGFSMVLDRSATIYPAMSC